MQLQDTRYDNFINNNLVRTGLIITFLITYDGKVLNTLPEISSLAHTNTIIYDVNEASVSNF